MAADQRRSKALPSARPRGDRAVGVVGVVDRNVDLLVHGPTAYALVTAGGSAHCRARRGREAADATAPRRSRPARRPAQQRGPHHRPDRRGTTSGSCRANTTASARACCRARARAVPDREGDRHERLRRRRRAAAGAESALEDDRPFAPVVAGDGGHVLGSTGARLGAAAAGDVAPRGVARSTNQRSTGVLAVAEEEVRLADAGRQLRREAGSRPRRRTRPPAAAAPSPSSPQGSPAARLGRAASLAEGLRPPARRRARRRRPALLFLARHREIGRVVPAWSARMSCQVNRKAISAVVDRPHGHAFADGWKAAAGLGDLADDREGRRARRRRARAALVRSISASRQTWRHELGVAAARRRARSEAM